MIPMAALPTAVQAWLFRPRRPLTRAPTTSRPPIGSCRGPAPAPTQTRGIRTRPSQPTRSSTRHHPALASAERAHHWPCSDVLHIEPVRQRPTNNLWPFTCSYISGSVPLVHTHCHQLLFTVSHHAPLVCFLATADTVDSVPHLLFSSVHRSNRGTPVWCSSWTCWLCLPITGASPHRSRATAMP
jgi:hypothetical protein